MKRRQFLKKLSMTAAGVMGFPSIVPASVLGRNGAVAPADRLVMAGIGCGNMGRGNIKDFLEKGEVQWVAVCDVDDKHLAQARDLVNSRYGNQDCTVTRDFREICLRKDIDAVSIATPDHWHALIAIACIGAGFDIYGEKPLTHNLVEGRALCDAVRRFGTVWQTGSWQRSRSIFHRAAELVRNQRIGKIRSVEVGLRSGYEDYAGTQGQETTQPPPPHLDYDLWLGPAPDAPYCPARVHQNWRWNRDYGGGQLMDWVGHHVDSALWGLGLDTTAPVALDATGEFPRAGIWNTATRYRIRASYADGTPLIVAGGYPEIREGIRWNGEHGWIFCDRDRLEAQPSALLHERVGPNEIRLTRSRDHIQNFLDCIKNRREPIAPAEPAHRAATVGHLGMIAMELGRSLRFDPEREKIIDDSEAERLLKQAYRSPWQLLPV